MNIERAIYEMAQGLSDLVHSPTYYDGPWIVRVSGRQKVCKNHATAKSWAKYFRRHGLWHCEIEKVIK